MSEKTSTSASAQNDTRNFAPLFGGSELKMSSTAKAVTPFGGLVSFFAWLGAIGYGARITTAMPFEGGDDSLRRTPPLRACCQGAAEKPPPVTTRSPKPHT